VSLHDDASQFNWLLNRFVSGTNGITDAVAVSSDGLLMAKSETLDGAGAEQVAAIIAGFVSLGSGAARCLAFDELNQVLISMTGGYLFVSAMADASCLGVIANPNCDIGDVGYQMGILSERCGRLLTPELVDELKAQVLEPARS
jgi:predicted regulator of Ras-like GTPase activity (Roadblock/LC7/MglB family)